jgi:hypothetical protein
MPSQTSTPTTSPATGAIDGYVFVENAGTGLYHVGDADVVGVTVSLLNAAGAVVATTMTDGNGDFAFAAVAPGTYSERFSAPPGLAFTPERAGADNTINSAANAAGATAAFSVAAGAEVTTENAGLALDGAFPGQAVTTIADGASISLNEGGPVVVGAGDDNVHLDAGMNVVLLGGGQNIVEAQGQTDIVTSDGPLNAQALDLGRMGGLGFSDVIFGGTGPNVLQGGGGSDFLMGGHGDDLLAGGNGDYNFIVGGGNDGTVQISAAGNVVGYTVGDEIRPGASFSTTIVFQKGDGVDLLDTFVPGQDTLDIYGYTAAGAIWANGVNGHTVLYLGGNDAIVFNSAYSGDGAGIDFIPYPTVPSAPVMVLRYAATGMPYFAAPATPPDDGADLPTVSSINDIDTLIGSGAGQRLIANDGQSFVLVGGTGGDVFIGGAGADTFYGNGSGNLFNIGDGDNVVVTGAGGAVVNGASADGDNLVFVAGTDNAVTLGDGDNVVSLAAGTGAALTVGNGANTIFAAGGDGDVITTGTGDNTLVAQINDSTVNVNGGQAFVFGDNDTVNLAAGVATLAVQGNNISTTGASGDLLLFQSGGAITEGAGNHQFYVTGANVSVSVTGAGDNTVIGPTGDADIAISGPGTTIIGLQGTGNTISVGDGNALIFAGQGDDTVTVCYGYDTIVAGAGDTLNIGAGLNQVWVGAGNDDIAVTPGGLYDIFEFGGGDRLDLTSVLSWVHDPAQFVNFVSVTNVGADTLVGIDTSGQPGGAVTAVATLHGISENFAQLAPNLVL